MIRTFAAALFGIGLLTSSAVHAADKTITLAVPGMDCAACPVIVKSSLEAVPGVVKVVVSFAEKKAIVTFDDEKTNPSALTAATAHAGYPSSIRG